LYDRFGPRLFAVAYRIVRLQQDAEDVVQEVFMGLYRTRGSIRRVRDLSAYLFSSLRHAALRRAQRRERRQVVPLPDVQPGPSQRAPLSAERAGELEAAVAALPVEQRQVIALKIDGELTFAQIGEVLGINPNTAASRYRYALAKLHAALAEKE
jgi:RNA polymerase sigma-70 factor (ECF subfamily)